MLIPEPKHTPTKHTPLPTTSQQSNTPFLHQQTANQKNTPPTLTPKEDPCVINALGGQPYFPAAE